VENTRGLGSPSTAPRCSRTKPSTTPHTICASVTDVEVEVEAEVDEVVLLDEEVEEVLELLVLLDEEVEEELELLVLLDEEDVELVDVEEEVEVCAAL
jgi:hypothetical protein